MKRLLLFLVLILIFIPVFSTFTTASQAKPAWQNATLEDELAAYLNAHPLLTDVNAHVRAITLLGEAITIDISAELFPRGVYDAAIITRLENDLYAVFNLHQTHMLTFKVGGMFLEFWGEPLPDFTPAPDVLRTETRSTGALSGKKIAINPGHGWYYNESTADWRWQRVYYYDIVEDLVNADIVRYLAVALQNQGATVIFVREPDKSARTGISGKPAWQEAARHYAIYNGLPASVYDGSTTNYNSDIRSRPYIANYYGADILINLHNNGYNGTLSGTESYYDITGLNHSPSQALQLASAIHNRIINTIRTQYDAAWVNRGIKASDGDYGEIRLAAMPATLIELAFMDKQYPDNAYLQDENFKRLAASAITLGVCDYFGITCDPTPLIEPITVETPIITPAYGGGMCDSGWYSFINQRGSNAYVALNRQFAPATHSAIWQTSVPANGAYKIEAFIPAHSGTNWQCPTLFIPEDTNTALYTVNHGQSTTISINQAPLNNQWAHLGVFYLAQGNPVSVSLTNVTGESSQTKTVSFSALRFTLIGAALQDFDALWLTDAAFLGESSTAAAAIHNFFMWEGSCLAEPFMDTDGMVLDMADVVAQSAGNHGINPKVLLAYMEMTHAAITTCPSQAMLANLMKMDGYTTARQQIDAAALQLSLMMAHIQAYGITPGGWAANQMKMTLDGINVTPASNAIAVLFNFNPYVGSNWGGNDPTRRELWAFYDAWQRYRFNLPLPDQSPKFIFLPLLVK